MVQVLAKCETRQALFEFQDIAQKSDGIILSRGNLGLDVLPEKMALIQKAVISNCNLMGKPVIITRVVDTMIHAPRPTRYIQPYHVRRAAYYSLDYDCHQEGLAIVSSLGWMESLKIMCTGRQQGLWLR